MKAILGRGFGVTNFFFLNLAAWSTLRLGRLGGSAHSIPSKSVTFIIERFENLTCRKMIMVQFHTHGFLEYFTIGSDGSESFLIVRFEIFNLPHQSTSFLVLDIPNSKTPVESSDRVLVSYEPPELASRIHASTDCPHGKTNNNARLPG